MMDATKPKKPLTCQECGGRGKFGAHHGYDFYDPPDICGWCDGTGEITPINRNLWLRFKQEMKRRQWYKDNNMPIPEDHQIPTTGDYLC